MTQIVPAKIDQSSKDDNTCRYCRKTFASKQGLASHIAHCPVRKGAYDGEYGLY